MMACLLGEGLSSAETRYSANAAPWVVMTESAETPQHRPKGLPKPPVLAVLQAPAANTHLRRHSGRIATRHGKEVDDTVEIDLGNSVDFV